MPVYTSKNAINNIPLTKQNQANKNSGGKLHSLLFQNNSYLVSLAKSDFKTSPLKIGSENEAVKLIKVALNFINERNDLYPGYIIDELDVDSYKFDTNLENAINAFQTWSHILITGTVDSETLLEIDSKFLGDEFFDAERKKYIGKSTKKEFSFIQQSFANNKYKYSISFRENDRPIKIELDTVLKGKIVRKDIIINDKNLNIELSNKTKNEILNKSEVQQILSKYGIDGQNFTVILNPAETKVQFGTANTFNETIILDYNLEEENTPPLLFNDEDAKLHKIVEGDTPSKIVLDNYYGGGGFPIMDPYNKTVIFNLPQRTPFPPEKRKDDARFQFYLNLLYYYNSEEKGTVIKEWGITKAGNYQRYPINHLNDINLFANKFEQDDSSTGLPNYYRFLKQMEGLNPNSKIEFDSLGNATSFTTIKGKNIRIPSRKFADSMYYFLNFRPNEMLTPRVIPPVTPNDEPTSIMEYVVDAVLDTFINKASTAIESIIDIASEVKSDAIALYHEAAEFFKKAYDFAIDILTKYWPRGLGGTIAIGGSITWGIPIQTAGNIEKSLYRKMSKPKELTIVYSTTSTLGVSVDAAVGTSVGLSTGGHGKSKRTIGLNLGAGVGAGKQVIIGNEYEFPVRRDETALLTMIINVFGGAMVNATADILEYLDVINLNPRQYLTKFEVSLEKKVTGWAGAQFGVDTGNGISKSSLSKEEEDEQKKNKSFGFIDNIFNRLPGIGEVANADFTSGIAFSYEVDYGTNPLTKNHEGRVFDTIDIDAKYYSQNSLSFGQLGSLTQKLFVNFGPIPGSSSIHTFLNSLSFDKDTMFGIKYSLKRIDEPDSLGPGDFDFKSTNVIVDTISGHSLKYNTPGQKVIKQISLYYGTFTGDVDTLCEPGTEIKYNFNAGTLYQMWQQGPTYHYTFENVLSLFRSIEFHKKVGFVVDGGHTKNIRIKKPDNNLTGQIVGAHRKGSGSEAALISKMLEQSLKLSKKNVFFEGGLALDIKMELEISLLAKAIKYYFKKLSYKYSAFDTETKRNNFEKREIAPKELIIKNKIRDKAKADALISGNPTETQVIAALGADFYDKLFDDNPLGIYPDDAEHNTFGLNVIIDQFIASKPQINHLTGLLNFLKGINPFNLYMNNKNPSSTENDDYGIIKIIDYFNFIATLAQLDVTLEAKAGLSFGGTVKAGEGATVGVALDALAEINYQAKLYNNGVLTSLDDDDPLRIIYDEIRSIFGLQSDTKRMGAKTVLQVLKK